MKPDKLILFVFAAIGLTAGLIVVFAGAAADVDFLNPVGVEGSEIRTPEGKRAEMRFVVLGFPVYSRTGNSFSEFENDQNLADAIRYAGFGLVGLILGAGVGVAVSAMVRRVRARRQ